MFHLAYIVTHPIQYQAPLLRLLAASGKIDLKVFFLSDFSLHEHREAAFGQTFKWDVNLTDGYDWEVLPRWGIGRSTSMRPWWPVRGLKERLKAGRFDAVWVHGWGHIGLRQAIRAASSLNIPVLLRGESTPDQPSPQTLRRRLRNYFCRKLFRGVAGFLCIGSLNREFYRTFGVPEERLFSVPYAVDNVWFQARCREAALRREIFRKELGLEPGRAVILFAAKFIPVKAPQDLLAAYQRVWGGEMTKAEILPSEVANQPNEVVSPLEYGTDSTGQPCEVISQELHRPGGDFTGRGLHGPGKTEMLKAESRKPYLLFVGDGPLRRELEAQAGAMKGTDVRFLGFKNQSELPAFYDLCDVFVLPSVHEPWGLVVNEVMNAGKPVIVSDRVGAAPDLVQPGINGWIFPHGNVAVLADCLKQAADGADLQWMGQRSLEIISRWDYGVDAAGLIQALGSGIVWL